MGMEGPWGQDTLCNSEITVASVTIWPLCHLINSASKSEGKIQLLFFFLIVQPHLGGKRQKKKKKKKTSFSKLFSFSYIF